MATSIESFWSSVKKTDYCWEWQRPLDANDYGDIRSRLLGERMAHRISYTIIIGPIPDDLDLDHLCLNKACVNPDHLEPVTKAENATRATEQKLQKSRNEFARRYNRYSVCLKCGTPEKNIYSKHCSACSPSHKERYEWPEDHELLRMVKETNFVQTAKLIGCSDNAIRKRLKAKKLL